MCVRPITLGYSFKTCLHLSEPGGRPQNAARKPHCSKADFYAPLRNQAVQEANIHAEFSRTKLQSNPSNITFRTINMDPIAAVGLASGILTFIDAGTKLIKTAYAINNSLDGVLEDNRHREDVAGTVQDAASRLEITGILALTKEQQSLTDLAKKCKAISEDLVHLLEDIKPKGSSFKAFNALRHALKANKNKNRIGDLEGQLKDYRDQLFLALIDISRYTYFIDIICAATNLS